MPSDGYKKRTYQAKLSGDQSNVQIIAPGDNGSGNGYQRIIIDHFTVTLSATGTFKLTSKASNTDVCPAFNIAAATPLILDRKSMGKQMKSNPGEGVGVTTTGGGDPAIVVEYHYEP